jgi:hypothetical protein
MHYLKIKQKNKGKYRNYMQNNKYICLTIKKPL